MIRWQTLAKMIVIIPRTWRLNKCKKRHRHENGLHCSAGIAQPVLDVSYSGWKSDLSGQADNMA